MRVKGACDQVKRRILEGDYHRELTRRKRERMEEKKNAFIYSHRAKALKVRGRHATPISRNQRGYEDKYGSIDAFLGQNRWGWPFTVAECSPDFRADTTTPSSQGVQSQSDCWTH
jgi:hypothetical protein